MTREDAKVGQCVRYWYDQGAGFGYSPIYAKVLRVNRVTATILNEYGRVERAPFHLIEQTTPLEEEQQ